MLVVKLVPVFDGRFIAVSGQGRQVASIMLAGEAGQPALESQVPDKFVDPVLLLFKQLQSSRPAANRLEAFERRGDQFAKASKKINAHTGMKSLGIAATNCY